MKRLLITLLVVLGLGTTFAFAASPSVYADAKSEICSGIGAATGVDPNNKDGCTPPEKSPTIEGLIKTIVNVLSWIVGVLAVIMIIYAGFQYVTSGGDSGKISNAKNTLIYAIIGIVIVAFSQAIVFFVLSKV